eukprot:CAMPEP_0194289324 /NCGR_PEP_ID=MMETSP0169-20130528/38839_1 /TAXON_ID=218684 /ORGANISM="Corethron pennatum, Strain L29A3" /LENGTH=127 /DNA_ID=CAMNT_0039036569 /DNA_START=69 /DNA_END=452 /DNA_ORIENTATION=-
MDQIAPDEIPDGFTAADPNFGQKPEQQAAKASQDSQRESILDQALEPEARQRLRRLRLVKPDKAETLEKAIAAQAMSGRLPGRINEGKLIEMLERSGRASAAPVKISFQRKKCAFDSDDEDDDDDLL